MLREIIQEFVLADVLVPVGIALALLGAIAWLRFLKKPGRPWKTILYVILILGVVEFGVFQNPLFFVQCSRHLRVADIGYKQRDTLRIEAMERRKPKGAEYLALGSSQVWAVFYEYAANHDNLETVSVAGLGIAEYLSYRDIIERHCGGTVLLYISDNDLGREYGAYSFKLMPPHSPRDLAHVSGMLRDMKAASIWEIANLWIARYVSLYRYQFIARGVLNKLTREEKAFATHKARDAEPAQREEPKNDDVDVDSAAEHEAVPMANLTGLLERTDDWFDVNLAELDRFVAWCAGRDLKVIVVQGHYHPEAVAQRLERRERARALVEVLCAKHDNARFIAEDELRAFTEEDYLDGTHVRLESGAEFTEALMTRLASKPEAE